MAPLSQNLSGYLRTVLPSDAPPSVASPTLTAWSTGVNTTQTLMSGGGWPAFILSLKESASVTAGAVTIEGTYDGSFTDNAGAAFPLLASQLMNNQGQCTSVSVPVSLITVPAQTLQLLVFPQGFAQVRARITSNVTGGTVTPTVNLLPVAPYNVASCNPLAPGNAAVGTVGVSQGFAATTTVVGSGSNLVVKTGAGNLQNAYVTSSAAGWVFIINAASLPGNGALTRGVAAGNLQGCFELQKGVTDWQASINYNPGPWEAFNTGIVVGISSTDCPTLTASATGTFLHANAN
ncbi:MAG: hypothetical protein LAO23_19640 [Acidobacteriia bacterium]|nr:hypothetical protein [Terriglobia bacterium]